MASMFSMPQMMTTLSFRSRITSSSNSFQPITDSSISTSEVGDRSRPRRQISSYSSTLKAMPPPVPPRVNEGRITHGRPITSRQAAASARVWTTLLCGTSSPILIIASLNSCRSSALRMTSGLAARRITPWRASAPVRSSSIATLRPVWPAHGRQDRVRLLLRDHLLDALGRHRLDVGPVRDVRVRHDRRGVAVDEDDLVPLLAEGLARLGPRVVELGRLADHDRAGAEDQDATDVGALGHSVGIPSTGVGPGEGTWGAGKIPPPGSTR